MSEEQSEYVGGLLLIGFMHRLYEEHVDSSVLRLLKKKKKTDRRDIIAKLAQVGDKCQLTRHPSLASRITTCDCSLTLSIASSIVMMVMMMMTLVVILTMIVLMIVMTRRTPSRTG